MPCMEEPLTGAAMSRALLCLTLSTSAPALTGGRGPTRLSPFGRWLHQQLSAASRQWPAVAFRRLLFEDPEVRLVLHLRHPAPPLVIGLAVARALQRETTSAARAAGWLEPGQKMWLEARTLLWCLVDKHAECARSAGPEGARRPPALGCGASGALRLLAQRR